MQSVCDVQGPRILPHLFETVQTNPPPPSAQSAAVMHGSGGGSATMPPPPEPPVLPPPVPLGVIPVVELVGTMPVVPIVLPPPAPLGCTLRDVWSLEHAAKPPSANTKPTATTLLIGNALRKAKM